LRRRPLAVAAIAAGAAAPQDCTRAMPASTAATAPAITDGSNRIAPITMATAGSNRSTAKEATHEVATAEAKRAALIEQIDLRLVSNRDGRQ
jgi:hypothetical protein